MNQRVKLLIPKRGGGFGGTCFPILLKTLSGIYLFEISLLEAIFGAFTPWFASWRSILVGYLSE